MRRFITYASAVILLLGLLAWSTGILGFSYPEIIENQPLLNPVKVVQVVSNRFMLEDHRMVEVETTPGIDITNQLAESGYMIDLELNKGSLIGIYARQDGWVCGTRWAQPIRIPIFPTKVYKNRRELIAIGNRIEE